MTKRPNFILYITDQHRADFLGCYGHPLLKTPNIDALAAQGVCFDRFYVASPVCMPNRASLMTARVPSSHNVRFNGVPLDKRHVTFVELLRDAGYKTALIGKSHLQGFTGAEPTLKLPDTRPGFYRATGELIEAERHSLNEDIYKVEEPDFWNQDKVKVPTPFYGFDYVDLITGHGDNCGGDYKHWLLEREPNATALIGEKNQLSHDYICPQAIRTAIPEELYSTTYIAERAETWLQENSADDQPFFLMVSWPDPHHPFNPPGHYWEMYDPNDFPIPEAFTRNDWNPPTYVDSIRKQRETGKANLKGMVEISCSAREAQEAQALTCGMITMIDDALGRVEQAVEATGVSNETVKIFTTDHGDHLGDHRLLFKGAGQYEQITRVPFIWSDPNGDKAIRRDSIGQTLDIGTTILEHAKIEAAVGMQGQNLLSDTRPNEAYIQYTHQQEIFDLSIIPHIHSLISPRYRLSIFVGIDRGELYDLDKDPGEFENLWDSSNHQSIKTELIERLVRAQIANLNTSPMPTARA